MNENKDKIVDKYVAEICEDDYIMYKTAYKLCRAIYKRTPWTFWEVECDDYCNVLDLTIDGLETKYLSVE